MAYNRTEIFEQAKEAAKVNRLIWVEEIVSFLPCSKPTFYEFFPADSDELNSLKEILDKNKIEMKSVMRIKWYDSENATLQVALMKILSNEEEAARLNGSNQKIDVTTGGEKLNTERPVYQITINGQVKDPDNA